MTDSVYLAGLDAASGKSVVALGLGELLTRKTGRVAVFRPVVRDDAGPDGLVELLNSRFGLPFRHEDCIGTSYGQVRNDPDAAMSEIIDAYHRLAQRSDAVLIIGTDYTDVASPTEFDFNLRVAVNLASPVLLVVSAQQRSRDEVVAAVAMAESEAKTTYASVCGVVINRADPNDVNAIKRDNPQAWVLPEVSSLTAPTIGEYAQACQAELVFGPREQLGRQTAGLLVAAMTLPNMLEYLSDDIVIITPGDRTDLLLGLLVAYQAADWPSCAGIVLTGGLRPTPPVDQLVSGLESQFPVLVTGSDTFSTAAALAQKRGRITADSESKIATALGLFSDNVDASALLDRLRLARSHAVTPLMFEHDLVERARMQRKRIVLPEGTQPRILRAADICMKRGIADVVLVADPAQAAAAASRIGVDIAQATVVSPYDPKLRDEFAAEYAQLRHHKGVTLEQATDIVTDVSYFGTMMVQCEMADGMVSGVAHTTANTIRPALEVIKTIGNTVTVSSVFFMCLEEKVLVYGDCAVNPDPNAAQLADIAISSADTAAALGIKPRVAMLSYSTGSSGSGADVDKVRQATEIVRERRDDLLIDGPMQYDAAVDSGVASTKLPKSEVAGRATVLIVPDLNTGNNLYKAVQRSAGAVAVGPILQGLRKPVNDLSRGATVHDIVNTVALTAIQAQEDAR